MNTIKDLVVAKKIRKGTAHGTTKRGAFWGIPGPGEGIKIRRAGGDGVGHNAPDITYWLNFRHYRNGEVSAVVDVESWHQNSGHHRRYIRADEILACTTVEEVVVALKGIRDDLSNVYSDSRHDDLSEALTSIGLPVAAPSPDEAQ